MDRESRWVRTDAESPGGCWKPWDEVHNGIQRLLDDKTIKRNHYDDEQWNHLVTWVHFAEDHPYKTAAIEEPIWDLRRKIASCIDWRGILDDKHTALDWKTSSAIYDSHLYHTNEYGHTYNKQKRFDDLGPMEQVGILRTGSKHKRGYELKTFPIDEYKHKIFNCLLWIEHSKDPDWKPRFPKPLPESLTLPPNPDGAVFSRGAADGNGETKS